MVTLIGRPVSWLDAFVIETLAQPIRAASHRRPRRASGPRSWAASWLCTFLGMAEADAVTLWLLKRAREMFFDSVGLAYLAARRPAERGHGHADDRAAARSGGSGLEVSRLGVGLAAIARPGYITLGRAATSRGRAQPGRALRARRRGARRGARRRRPLRRRRAELRARRGVPRRAGSCERGVARDELTVGSKWGYRYTAGWRSTRRCTRRRSSRWNASRRSSRRPARCSAIGLGPLPDPQRDGGVGGARRRRAARRARRRRGARGAFRAVGLTLSGPESARALELALAARVDGERVFDVVQATFNVLEPSLAPGLAAAHDDGTGRDREGGVRERPADRRERPTRGRARCSPRLHAAAPGVAASTGSRSPSSWRIRSSTSRSRARRRSRSSRRTSRQPGRPRRMACASGWPRSPSLPSATGDPRRAALELSGAQHAHEEHQGHDPEHVRADRGRRHEPARGGPRARTRPGRRTSRASSAVRARRRAPGSPSTPPGGGATPSTSLHVIAREGAGHAEAERPEDGPSRHGPRPHQPAHDAGEQRDGHQRVAGDVEHVTEPRTRRAADARARRRSSRGRPT